VVKLRGVSGRSAIVSTNCPRELWIGKTFESLGQLEVKVANRKPLP